MDKGGAGMKALLPASVYEAMRNAPVGTDAGYGWGVCQRSWAGGKALSHAGSNTMNYCVAWLAPGRHFGVIVCTNHGGDQLRSTNAAASALIQYYQR
jgi:hypothetical protein